MARAKESGHALHPTKPTPPPPNGLRSLDRFARLGLRANPFRLLDPEEQGRAYVAWWGSPAAAPVSIAVSADPVIQVLGAPGWGKSALLAAVADALRERGEPFHEAYLPPEYVGTFLSPPRGTDILLLDEAQRLSRRGRREGRAWLTEGRRRIVATSHNDLRRSLGVQARTVRLPPADARAIQQVFVRRLELAGGDAERLKLSPEATAWLAARADGSLRWVEDVLYEVFQSLEPAATIVVHERDLRVASAGLRYLRCD